MKRDLNPNIYIYLSSRPFLLKLYQNHKEYRKRLGKAYSVLDFSSELGLEHSSHLYQFMRGKKSLSNEIIQKLVKKLPIPKKEKQYFMLLISGDSAKSPEDKKNSFEKILKFRLSHVYSDLDQQTIQYLSHWANIVIREMVGLVEFDPKPKAICERMHHLISEQQASQSFELLQELGLIKFEPKRNRWVQVEKEIILPEDVHSSVLARTHCQFLDVAKELIWLKDDSEREIVQFVIGVEEDQFESFSKELSQAIDKVCDKYTSEKPDVAINVGYQLLKVVKKKS